MTDIFSTKHVLGYRKSNLVTICIRCIHLSFLFLLFCQKLIAQDFTSKDNTIANWKENNTWVENSIPSNTGAANSSLNIEGTVTLVNDDLVLDNNNTSTVTDTLWIQGDLTISNNSSLTVNTGGVLIVDGALSVNGGSFTNKGVASIDNYDIQGGSIINENKFYTFNIYNNNNYGYGTITNHEPPRDIDDFENDHGTLFEKLQDGTLPIQLLSFTSKIKGNTVQLDWISSWEENFDFYTIERAGKDKVFKAIGTLKGKGNSTIETDYSFTDHNPIIGQSFYRLKATDFDGYYEYHNIISTFYSGPWQSSVRIYPNPVLNQSLKIETTAGTASKIRLFDKNGRVVYTQKMQRGINEINLPVDISAGQYILIIENERGEQQRHKVVIL